MILWCTDAEETQTCRLSSEGSWFNNSEAGVSSGLNQLDPETSLGL